MVSEAWRCLHLRRNRHGGLERRLLQIEHGSLRESSVNHLRRCHVVVNECSSVHLCVLSASTEAVLLLVASESSHWRSPVLVPVSLLVVVVVEVGLLLLVRVVATELISVGLSTTILVGVVLDPHHGPESIHDAVDLLIEIR